MDRKTFFDKVRASPFNGTLSQDAVDGMNAFLDAWEASGLTDLRWAAYMLATMLAEVGPNMRPVREGFKSTDAAARGYVKARSYKYAEVVNGQVYYGRGLVQLTWFANYQKMSKLIGVDLVKEPDLALRPDIATQIMFKGMTLGTFTGKKLADYFKEDTTDWVNARRIINALDRAQEIAGYGKAFFAALLAARAVKPKEDDVIIEGVVATAAKPIVDAFAKAIEKAVTKTAVDPTTKVPEAVAQPVPKAEIVQEAVKQIVETPEFKHSTNSEAHWWQQRSKWSMIIGLVGVVAAPILAKYGLNFDAEKTIDLMVAISGLVASYLAWRAGTATRPLGA